MQWVSYSPETAKNFRMNVPPHSPDEAHKAFYHPTPQKTVAIGESKTVAIGESGKFSFHSCHGRNNGMFRLGVSWVRHTAAGTCPINLSRPAPGYGYGLSRDDDFRDFCTLSSS